MCVHPYSIRCSILMFCFCSNTHLHICFVVLFKICIECCRNNKSDTTITASASNSSDSDTSVTHGQSSPLEQNQLPPNYEEIDPPPSYSTLFPNQKEVSNEPMPGPNIAEHDSEAGLESVPSTTNDVAVTVESVPSSWASVSLSFYFNYAVQRLTLFINLG